MCYDHQSGHFWRHKCLFLDNFAKHEMDRIDLMKKIVDKNRGGSQILDIIEVPLILFIFLFSTELLYTVVFVDVEERLSRP